MLGPPTCPKSFGPKSCGFGDPLSSEVLLLYLYVGVRVLLIRWLYFSMLVYTSLEIHTCMQESIKYIHKGRKLAQYEIIK